MNANLFRHELRARLPSIGIWSLALAVIIIFFFAFFPLLADQASLMNEMLADYPPELRAAFGLDNVDLSSVLGFYSFTFLFAQLCLAIQASNYGFGLVSVEETERTADFLLSKPVSRAQVLTSKLLAALAGLLVTEAVVALSSLAAIGWFTEGQAYAAATLGRVLLSQPLFQLSFLGLGLAGSLLVKRVRSVTPYALGLSFGMYILSGFSGVFGQGTLDPLTPFKHFDAAYIVAHNAYAAPLVALNAAIALGTLAAGYWLYLRRDVPAIA